MREEVRFAGRILSATISRQADAWYASFAIEVEYESDVRTDDTVVGVDLGITALATLSGGLKVNAPEPLRRYLQKLKRLSRSLSRKQRGSRNRVKAKTKLATIAPPDRRHSRRHATLTHDVAHALPNHCDRRPERGWHARESDSLSCDCRCWFLRVSAAVTI
jgi:putative transposase